MNIGNRAAVSKTLEFPYAHTYTHTELTTSCIMKQFALIKLPHNRCMLLCVYVHNSDLKPLQNILKNFATKLNTVVVTCQEGLYSISQDITRA